ncbi:MAG: Uncharacterized protein CEO12_655 [Parcubacteria group bacterium Gr01-1014_46]|nr:MAG: Uncharacterized protein CEO12_655 [Parcubacteria group bacterium Gr01-1014_46]
MKKYKHISLNLVILTLLFPLVSSAQTRIMGLLQDFWFIVQLLPRIIFGLAVVYFFWGTGQFILHAGDEKFRADGKKKMLWSVITLFVFISIYGILKLLGQLVGFLPWSAP